MRQTARLGHDVGDQCIVNAANILRSVETNKITAYRYGGDEFVMLIESCSDPERILDEIKERFRKYGDKLKVPVALAVGYARFDENKDTGIVDTQRRADEQMYEDKMKIKKEEELAESH